MPIAGDREGEGEVEGCSVEVGGCSVEVGGCSVEVEGCSVEVGGCSVHFILWLPPGEEGATAVAMERGWAAAVAVAETFSTTSS